MRECGEYSVEVRLFGYHEVGIGFDSSGLYLVTEMDEYGFQWSLQDRTAGVGHEGFYGGPMASQTLRSTV